MPTGSLGKTVLKLHRGTNLDVCLSKQHLLETTIVGHWKSGGGKLHCRIQKMTSFCHLAPSHMKRWMHARGYRAIHSAYIHQHYYTERAHLFVRKKTELWEKATAYVFYFFLFFFATVYVCRKESSQNHLAPIKSLRGSSEQCEGAESMKTKLKKTYQKQETSKS